MYLNVYLKSVQKSRQKLENSTKESGQYHDYDAINEYISQLPESGSVGETIEGRNFWVVEKINENANKTIMVDCGRAGRDWVPVSFCLDLIERTCEKKELTNINWIIVPMANPDGYQYTHSSDRFYGVTLN